MASESDLFDVFEEPVKVESSTGRTDKMKTLEKEKHLDAKSRAEDLLKTLSEGLSVKRKMIDLTTDGDIEDTLQDEKKSRLEDEDYGSLETMPRIRVHMVECEDSCSHEVAFPPEMEFKPLVPRPGEPVREFPFELDGFQREALACIDNDQSVMVSAHTSAGKTVVAEYAIATSLKQKQRVIYTTPIKALSNQKYREMFEAFGDVGLMTGDVTINSSASCLVMTTEILRSMLYRGSEIMREVGWVVFDEIHYMRDKDRGVVWEESIILLPDNVHYVFLSATIPNARQFAEWICFLHRQPCHVVYTDKRPVPLQHYIYPAGGEGIHLVLNEKGEFRQENFEKAMSTLAKAGDAGKEKKGRKGGSVNDEASVFKLVRMIMEKQLCPVIVFSFSRKECESYALQVAKLDFNKEEEKQLVVEVFNNALDVLSDEDKQLPQVEHVLPLLKRGIGIHHSGLLPILKETIEILFGEGLIKVLFATETFAMGLNMPAKTVMFTSFQKFDGQANRSINSGEYIQMSGRAGRRGKDDKGIVISVFDRMLITDSVKQILKGDPDPLNSAFRLTYNMVLNLIRVEGINPEFMLERSFYQFQNFATLPDMYTKVKALQEKVTAIKVDNETELAGYYRIKRQIASLGQDLQKIITKPNHIVPFLQPGRLIRIASKTDDFGWGVVVNFHKKQNSDPISTDPIYVVDTLLNLSKETSVMKDTALIKPAVSATTGQMEVVPVLLGLIQKISSARLYLPSDLKSKDNRQGVLKTLEEVQKRFPDGLPPLDPVEDMQISDSELKETVRKIEKFEERMFNHPIAKNGDLKELCAKYDEKLQAQEEFTSTKNELKKAKSLLQLDELKCRKRVLRRMGYCNDQDVITLKGRVSCEISAADELLLTEMLFNGIFNELSVPNCVALLSCFVFEEKGDPPELSDELSGLFRQIQEIAKQIARIKKEAKLEIDEEEYVNSFKPQMMQVVHSWACGAKFIDLCKLTDVFEGSIIRCMRRLEELIREMCCAAKSIGNADLEKKFAEGIVRIKRDIIFAASLYL